MSFKLNEKKNELKKLFTIDSILCVNQKEIELDPEHRIWVPKIYLPLVC